MEKVGDNIVTTGLSGKLGSLIVFYNRGGKTYVAIAPKKKQTDRNAAQQQHRLRFQEAVFYAKNAIADESTKEAYQASAKLFHNGIVIMIGVLFSVSQWLITMSVVLRN